MEDQFITAVSILLPPIQFVEDGQRDTLLELVVVICSEPHDVVVDLKSQRHVEILRYSGFAPE